MSQRYKQLIDEMSSLADQLASLAHKIKVAMEADEQETTELDVIRSAMLRRGGKLRLTVLGHKLLGSMYLVLPGVPGTVVRHCEWRDMRCSEVLVNSDDIITNLQAVRSSSQGHIIDIKGV